MVRSTTGGYSRGDRPNRPFSFTPHTIAGIVLLTFLVIFCGAASADSQVTHVNLSVDPGLADQDNVWNVSFHINRGLVNDTDGFFITFDQDFTVDTYFNPECITVTYDGQSAHPNRIIIIHNPNPDYPLYQPGTTTVKFNNPLNIPFNNDVLITFSCGIHNPCPINCSGYHVWANTDMECVPSISNDVYLLIPVTAVSGTNGTIESPDGFISPPLHTQDFACGATPVYSITPDPFFSIANVTVDFTSVIDTPGWMLFPDGHAEYTFPPLECYHIIRAEFEAGGNITIQKIADREIVSPGEVYTYQISYGNFRPFTTEDVTIVDILPDELDFVSATSPYTFNGTAVTWDLDDLAPGEQGTVNLTVEVKDDVESTSIVNCATITGEEVTPATSCSEVYVYQIAFEKESSVTQAAPGQEFVYTLSYENPGDNPITNVTISDLLPPELNFISASGGGSYDGTYVNWTIGTLPGMADGEVTFTVRVKDSVVNGTQILNCGIIDSDQTVPRTACILVPVGPILPLELTKIASEYTVLRNETFDYVVHFRNPSMVNLTGTYILDSVPADLEFVSASDGGILAGQTVNWSIGTLLPGEFGDRTLTVRVKETAEPGNITNCATIFNDQTDPVQACVDVTVIGVTPPVLEKYSSTDEVVAGETFTYTLEYENFNEFALTGASLVDILPGYLEFINATGPFTFNGTAVTWAIGTIPGDSMDDVTLTVQVDMDTPSGIITNCGTLFTDQADPVQDCMDVNVTGIIPPVLEKYSSTDEVVAGETFTYTLEYENFNAFGLTGASLVDILPGYLEFVNATAPYTFNGTAVTWDLGTLPAKSMDEVTLTVQVNEDAPSGTITNCGTLFTDQADPVQDCMDVNVTGIIPPVLEKYSSKDKVIPGETFTYTLEYENFNEFGLTGASLVDILPDYLEFIGATTPYTFNGTAVIWDIGTIAGDSTDDVTLTVRVAENAPSGIITNCGALFTDQADPVTDCDNVTVIGIIPPVLEKYASTDVALPGDTFTYTLEYENFNEFNLTGASLIDVLPGHVEFVNASEPYTFNGTAVTWDLGTLPADSMDEVTFTVKVAEDAPSGIITNCGTLLTNQADPVQACVDVVVVNIVPGLTKSASKTEVNRGETFNYTIMYENPSEYNLTGGTLVDVLPERLLFDNATGNWSILDSVITWYLEPISPGASGYEILTVKVKDNAPFGNFSNCVSIFIDQAKPVEACVNTTVIEVLPPVLEKHASADTVIPGEIFTYTLEYENFNEFELTGASLVDILPGYLAFINATAPYTFNGTAVTWDLGTLQGDSMDEVTLTVQVDGDAPSGVITNCGTLFTDQSEPVQGCDNVTVIGVILPVLEKYSSEDEVIPRETFTYTLEYENFNEFALTGASLIDILPDQVEFVSATAPYTFNGTAVTWNIGTLPADSMDEVDLTVMVRNTTEPGIITNCATLYTDQTDPVEDCVNVTVIGVIPPILEKYSSTDQVIPNETFTYTLEYENFNEFNLTGASLIDILPGYVEFVNASGPYIFNGTAVTWDIGTLSADSMDEVTLTVRVDADAPAGIITNCGTLFTDQSGPVQDCVNVTVIRIIPPVIEKDPSRDEVLPGETFTYTLEYENFNEFNLTRALLIDAIPDGLEFVNATGDWTIEDSTVTWYIGTIGPDEQGQVTLTVEVDSDTPTGIITNCAMLLTDETPTVQDCANITVVGCVPSVDLEKTASLPEVAPGESFVYTIEYRNSCCANLTGVVVSDHLPDEVVFVSATHGGVYDGNNVTWSIGQVPACANGELEIIVQVPLIINDPAVENVVTFFSDQLTVTATNTTVINPARVPDPHKVLVYPPVARFVAIPRTGVSPLSVKFMDFSTGSPTGWLWDFGDTTTSHQKSPTHVYTSPGTYTVTFTAMNNWGANTVIKTNEIKVGAAQTSSGTGTGTGASILDKIRPPWYHG
jgi:uncharacterized repeat protein (TIGR01451 family)